ELIRIMNLLNAYNLFEELVDLMESILGFLKEKKGYNEYSKIALVLIPKLLELKIYDEADKIINFLIINQDKIEDWDHKIKVFYYKLMLHIEYVKLKTMSSKVTEKELDYHSNWLELEYEYKIYNVNILSSHLKKLQLNSEDEEQIMNKLKIVLLHFRIQDFDTVDNKINELSRLIKSKTKGNSDFNLLIKILQIEAAIQAGNFLKLNQLFIEVVENFDEKDFLKDEMSFLIFWAYRLSENGFIEEGKNALIEIKKFCEESSPKIYSKLIFLLFRISIQESDEIYKTYLKLLIDKYEDYLDYPEKHFIRLIAAEDSSFNINLFEEAMDNYKKSNKYLMKNWNAVISNVNDTLHDIQDIDPKLINKAIQINFKEVLLDSNLHINHFLQSLENVFENLRSMYQRVQDLSLKDQLTGLNNRRFLKSNFSEMFFLAKRQGIPISLAMFDLDDFKQVNDKYGHPVGDTVLIEFSKILKNSFRQSDIIVRYGGEEFLVVLFDANLEQSKIILEKVRTRYAKKTFYNDSAEEFKATVSAGLVSDYVYGNHVENILNKYVSAADVALYQSKTNGKNRISVFVN
ncbi:MAG: GGDEF domain-containing protein, partial [Candidatus Cloacimonadota bacterium]|nr:GGDEF domain-containing protein [Candidatus Cloacimonadota bacterium]